MTAKADKASLRIARCSAGIALLCLLPMAAAAKDGPYLTWHDKRAPVQTAGSQPTVQAPQVPVPPSPYGQVGDPYLHVLTWTAKSGGPLPRAAVQPQMALPALAAVPVGRAPVQQTAPYATAPAEPAYQAPRPAPATRLIPQPYRTGPMASTPPEPGPVQPAQPPARQPAPVVEAQIPAPVPAPRPLPAPAPHPQPQTQAATGGAYQVPANSPYAARIAAARAAQAKAQAQAQAQANATRPAPNAQPAPQAAPIPAPAPAVQAAGDDDKPFVPGEHYTDASEAPRLYSLHRAYGLKPDPITVDTNASGALLDTSDIDAKAAKAEKTDEDSAGDDRDADGVPAKSNTASASGTQNASDSKKAAQ